MYSRYFMKHVTTLCMISHRLGIISFTWNSSKGCYEVKSLKNTAKTLFHLINLLVYAGAFLPCQVLATRKAKDFEEFSLTVVIWMSMLMGDVMVGMCFWYAEEICFVFNGYYTFLRNFAGKFANSMNTKVSEIHRSIPEDIKSEFIIYLYS